MLLSLREETEGKLQMLLSPRKNGRTSLFKEARAFKGRRNGVFLLFFRQKRLEKAVLSISKHPARKVGTRSRAVWTRFLRQVCLSPVPEILEFKAFCNSGKIVQQFSWNFPRTSPELPQRPQKQPQPSRVF